MKATWSGIAVLSMGASAFLAGFEARAQVTAPGSPSIASVIGIIPGPSSQDRFRHPSGVFVDRERGVFLVADRGRHRLVLFDASGRCRGTIPFQASPDGEAAGEPLTLAADSSGRLFVIDAADNRVPVLTSRGSRLGALDLPAAVGAGARPQAVDIGSTGSIYLLCGGPPASVVVMDRDGKPSGPGLTLEREALDSAVSLAVDEAAGLLCLVSPRSGKQVRLYGLDGRLRAAFGAHGEGDGTFSMAGHAAWGPANTLWITDQLRHSISVFDARGGYLGRIGGFGRGPGQFSFPVACGFLSDDRLIVVERGASRCQILEVRMTPPDQRPPTPGDTVPLTLKTEDVNSTGGDSQ